MNSAVRFFSDNATLISAASTAISAIATIVSAIATIVIAYIAGHFAARTARIETDQAIASQLRGINLQVFGEGELATFYTQLYYPHANIESVREVYLIRARLSTLYDIFRADRTGALPRAMMLYDFDGWANLLVRRSPKALAYALLRRTGYSEDFLKYFRSRIPNFNPAKYGLSEFSPPETE